jgi:hypothetical protein
MGRLQLSSRNGIAYLLVIMLLFAWVLLRSSFPHRVLVSVGIPKWISTHVGSPLLYIDERKPADILLIGSSLLLAPPFRFLADEKEGHRMMAEGRRRFLSQCYEEALKKGLGIDYGMANISVPGSVAEDQRIIMDAVVNSVVKPKLVIYAFSPRDLIDNSMGKAPKENPVYRTFQFARAYSGQPEPNMEKIFEREWQFLVLVRKYVKDEVSSTVAESLGRPESLWEAVNAEKNPSSEGGTELSPAERLKNDLAVYHDRYLPFRQDYFDYQVNSFKQLLQICREHSVPIIVLHMPIAQSNLALLEPQLIETYAAATSEACRAGGVEEIDLMTANGKPYASSDFIDSCHLSKAGSIKFIKQFVEALKTSKTMQQAFSGHN